MTPHMGTATVETREAMGHRALDNVADVLGGRTAGDALQGRHRPLPAQPATTVRELQQQGGLAALTKVRSSIYLNNLIEQDRRNIKSRLGATLGLRR